MGIPHNSKDFSHPPPQTTEYGIFHRIFTNQEFTRGKKKIMHKKKPSSNEIYI